MPNENSYNLTRERWIPCAGLDNKISKLSLLDVLLRAHELSGIVHHSAIVPVSVLRVLLTILHRVFGPKTVQEWQELWTANCFHDQPIREYLNRWESRFNLFDTELPFYQDSTLKSIAVKVTVNRLFHQNSSGNNATLFDHSLDFEVGGVPNDEFALQLIAAQTFALGGLVTPDPSAPKESKSAEGSPTVKAILFSVAGQTLRETLLLNLQQYDGPNGIPFGNLDDCPAWERATGCGLITRTPKGMTDLMTWQSRRILAFQDSLNPGEVFDLAIMKGEQIPESFDLRGKDGMMAWRKLKPAKNSDAPGWGELSFRQDRAVWRDAHSLYNIDSDVIARPPVLDWISKLLNEERMNSESELVLEASGLGTDRAKIRSWHSESLPLPIGILGRPRLLQQVRLCQAVCDKIAEVIRESTDLLARLLLRPVQPENAEKNAAVALGNALSRREHFWSSMEGAFQRLVFQLVQQGEKTIDQDTGNSAALEQWFDACRSAASDSMSLTLNAAGNSARAYQAVATAERRFKFGILGAIPSAKSRGETATK